MIFQMIKSIFKQFRIRQQQSCILLLLLLICLYTQNSCTSSEIDSELDTDSSSDRTANVQPTVDTTQKPQISASTSPTPLQQKNLANQPVRVPDISALSASSPLASSPFFSPLKVKSPTSDTADLQTAVEELTGLLEQQMLPIIISAPPDSTALIAGTLLDGPPLDETPGNVPKNPDTDALAILADLAGFTPILNTVNLSGTNRPATQNISSTLHLSPTLFSSYLPLIMQDILADTALPTIDSAEVPVSPMPPLPTPDAAIRVANVPILMYHYLSVPPRGADIYRRDLSVSPNLFARHLDSMLEAGYQTISLYELTMHLTIGAPLPVKPVVITFDDGYLDSYENAYPLLLERGMTATFFVSPEFIEFQRPEYANWNMLREMYASGMSIEAHGLNHRSLKNRDVDFLAWQALASIQAIEREIGRRPRFVSYPAGEYDNLTIEVFQNSHFWAGVTTVQGTTQRSETLFRLQRVRVRNTTQPDQLLTLMDLDW